MAARNGVLPSAEELPALVPTPGSIVWRTAGDARLLFGAGYTLLLQVAHPVVGAGVREHSNFRADPWGRLLRTLDYTYGTTYGGPQLAGQIGRRIREMHKQIKGELPDGSRYWALEPEPYAWVHATLADAIVAGNERFGRPLRGDEREAFYQQWRALGRLIGVREADLPDDWSGFRCYFDRMVAERLEDTASVHDVLETLDRPDRPPLPGLTDWSWRVARLPAAVALRLGTVGMLPPILRERFGLRWTRAQELELRALGRAARAATPLMPAWMRTMGPGYLRWRHEAIERGDVASRAPGGGAERVAAA
jgi:uncharacterized protein (DUF2236 family)